MKKFICIFMLLVTGIFSNQKILQANERYENNSVVMSAEKTNEHNTIESKVHKKIIVYLDYFKNKHFMAVIIMLIVFMLLISMRIRK